MSVFSPRRLLGLARITLHLFVSVVILCVRPVISLYFPDYPKTYKTISLCVYMFPRLKLLNVESSATLDHPGSRDITVGGRQLVYYIPNSLIFLHEDQCKSPEIIDVMQCRIQTAASSKHTDQGDQQAHLVQNLPVLELTHTCLPDPTVFQRRLCLKPDRHCNKSTMHPIRSPCLEP